MTKYRMFCVLYLLIVFSSYSCAPTMIELKKIKTIESTSKFAFEKTEPKLNKLKPNEDINLKLRWYNLTLQDQEKTEYFSYADGWIGPLSGNHLGGLFGLGQITGRVGNKIFGEHVFGYLRFGTTLVPRYLVKTEGQLIQLSEYHELSQANYQNIGWLPTPGQPSGMPPEMHYKNVHVKNVRMLDFNIQEIDVSGQDIKGGQALSLNDLIKTYVTPNRFRKAEELLRKADKGIDVWDVVKKLNGLYFSPNSGIDYGLLMDGYLMTPWHKITSKGLFLVWTFGYLDGVREIRKLSLVFHNGELFKLVEYAPKEKIEHLFDD